MKDANLFVGYSIFQARNKDCIVLNTNWRAWLMSETKNVFMTDANLFVGYSIFQARKEDCIVPSTNWMA
jgi:hypothetical protein